MYEGRKRRNLNIKLHIIQAVGATWVPKVIVLPGATELEAADSLLGCLSANSTNAVQLAKSAAESTDEGAMDNLVTKLSELDAKNQTFIDTIKTCHEQARTSMSESMKDKEGLSVRVKSLEGEIRVLKKEKSVNRHKILLGQLAYMIDEVAVSHVFGRQEETRFQTVKDIHQAYAAGKLKGIQKQRWEQFCKAITRCPAEGAMHVSIDDVVDMTKPLRRLRFEPAQGTVKEKKSVTKENLLVWAKEFKIPVDDVKQLLGVALTFAEDEKPLMCRKDVSTIIEILSAA